MRFYASRVRGNTCSYADCLIHQESIALPLLGVVNRNFEDKKAGMIRLNLTDRIR